MKKTLFHYLVVNDDSVLANFGPLPPDMFLCENSDEVNIRAKSQFDEWKESAGEGWKDHPYYGHLEIYENGTFNLTELKFSAG